MTAPSPDALMALIDGAGVTSLAVHSAKDSRELGGVSWIANAVGVAAKFRYRRPYGAEELLICNASSLQNGNNSVNIVAIKLATSGIKSLRCCSHSFNSIVREVTWKLKTRIHMTIAYISASLALQNGALRAHAGRG